MRTYATLFMNWLTGPNRLSIPVVSVYRSIARQRRLYAQYAAGKTRYPVAKPGSSQHNLRRAFDVDLSRVPENLWPEIGKAWVNYTNGNGRWGGFFKSKGQYDPIHFDWPAT